MTTLDTLRARLDKVGQSHILAGWNRLDAASQSRLAGQIDAMNVDEWPSLVEKYVKSKPSLDLPADVKPAPYYPHAGGTYDAAKYKAIGEQLFKGGKVAAFVVAGGQGSRLGYEGPKGCYPATTLTDKPLFQVFAEQLLAARARFGRDIPWSIMTSPLNHAETTAFFEDRRYFGLGRENVTFFPQGVMPSFDLTTGKVLMSAPGEIATNPDGHGGSITALHKSGTLAALRARGIEHLSYFQVDNPHVKVCDPLFVGLHASAPDSSGEMSSKMVAKAAWDERVGVFCLVNGKLDVIEYSDLPQALGRATNPDGSLKFNAGSIAIHMLGVAFLERLATDPAFALPFHRAEKKIPCVDPATGAPITPAANNGVKLERFIFDALARAKASIVLETDRVEEFAPIKNATGADSVESCKKLQTLRAARWLACCGVTVPMTPSGEPDCIIEMSH
ncbi:MAG: UDPGP type 1 family protein [Planctomycetota bacterium]